MATYTVEQQVQQIYIGLLGRAADKPGLDYWVNEIDTGVLSIEELRANIVNEQPEYAAGLGSLSRAQVVAELYQNLFERAPEPAGLEYWVNGGGATVNIDQLVLAMVDGAGAGDRLVMENKTEAATYYTVQAGEDFTRDAANAAVENVDSTRASVEASKAATDAGTQASGETFTLTTGVDDLNGTNANDTFTGLIDNAGNATTLTALDSLNGGEGTDTLKINVVNGGPAIPAISLSSIETVNLRAAVALNADLSGASYSDVTTINSTQSANTLAVTARDTADVNVSGAADTITLDGGKNISVSDATTDAAITIGATTGPEGTINVVDSDQGNGAIAVDGGTDVTVSATSDDTGTITVGANTAASGAVAVTQTLEDDATAGMTGGAVAVTGGSSVDVIVNANSVADSSADDNDIAVGAIGVTGDDNTTSVNVTQNDNVTQETSAAVGGSTETASVKFGALKSGDALTVAGLTFTASKDLTAAQVAAAFSGLTATDTQDAGGSTANGVYTGAVDGSVVSGSASGDTVVFTSTNANANVGNLSPNLTNTSGNSVAPVTTVTDGAAVTAPADESLNDVVFGAVTVADGGADSITDVTLNGYGNSTVSANALTNLSLANGEGTLGVTSSATALDLTVNDVDGNVTLDNALTSLNLTAETEASVFQLAAANLESLTVAAGADLDLTGSTLSTSLETVAISGAGEVNLTSIAGATGLTSFDASANTGGVTTTVNADSGTITGGISNYAFGSGSDDVTLAANIVNIGVDLGAGDDTLTLNAGSTAVPTAAVAGGAGTDTMSMTGASAQALDDNTNFATAISGFERLTISDRVDVDGGVTVDLEALGFNYVTTSGTTDSDTSVDGAAGVLTLDKMANGGTVVLTDTAIGTPGSSTQVNVKDAATGTADVLNVVTQVVQGDIDAGTLTVANVETINITADDVDPDHDGDGNLFETGERQESTLDLDAVNATSVVIDGDADLDLDMTGNTAVTSIDGSAMTGSLTVTAFGTATVTGGSGNDALTADGSGDTLIGGAGNDTLTGANLTQLTGGAGADTFVINTPTNVNSYSTITDLEAGDVIDLDSANAGTVVFSSAAVTLAGTAVFQDYANEAVNNLGADANDAAWFQFDGNTYIVQSGNATAGNDFVNGEDSIIQITGLVDLSTASYNQDQGTLEIA